MEPEIKEGQGQKPIRKLTLGSSLGYIIGGIFILGGILQISSSPVSAIFITMAGLIVFPPFLKFVRNKWRLEISRVMRVILFVILMAIGGSAVKPSDTPVATPTPQGSNTPANTSPQPSATLNPEKAAVTAYSDAFLNNVYPVMITANEHVSAAGSAGASYDFDTAKTEVKAAINDFNKAQTAMKSIKNIPQGLANVHKLILSAISKYLEGAKTVERGITNYDADTIKRGTEIYSEGTTILNQATAEMNAFTEANK